MRHGSIILAFAIGVALLLPAESLRASEASNIVKQAFELRMQGKADQARTLLEEAMAKAAGNGALYYELARTNMHIGLGRPAELMSNFGENVEKPIAKAVKIDPRNGAYASFAGEVAFFRAYMSMKKGVQETKERVGKMCRAYETAARLDPASVEPLLCLVEIYGVLPENLGGDKDKAATYVERIEKMDTVAGAKARAILLEDEERVAFWRKVLKTHEGNADVLEELGKYCLFDDKLEEGTKCLEQAMKADPARTYLLLDLARFYLYRVIEGEGPKEEALAAAEQALKRYLETKPIPPMKAYAMEMMAKVMFGRKDEKGAKAWRAKAEALDPFYSKAMGMPSPLLFVPPGEKAPAIHRYLFRPL